MQELQTGELHHTCIHHILEKITQRTSGYKHALDTPFIPHIVGECADGGRLVGERLHVSSPGATGRVGSNGSGEGAVGVCENAGL